MESFPGLAGELVVVLALCSSLVNFALSYAVQPFVDSAGYGWAFFTFGLLVLASMVAGVPLMIYGKRWRRAGMPKYRRFQQETALMGISP